MTVSAPPDAVSASATSDLAQAVVDYSQGMHAAAERPARFDGWCRSFSSSAWELAAWDAVFGSWGNAVASGIYLVLLLSNCSGGRSGGSDCWPMPTAPRRSPSIFHATLSKVR